MKKRRIQITNRLWPYAVILGCGKDRRTGWVGLDCGEYGQECLWDLRDGLPFADNSCQKLLADQVLEHIQLTEDFVFIMNECLRVLWNSGKMEIFVPYYTSYTAFKDPTHTRFFTEDTFTYLEKKNHWEYGFDKGWKILKNEVEGGSQLHVILQKI